MNLISDVGLVLRRTRHLEGDLRLTVLLRNTGKLSIVSKAALKPTSKLKSLQEPFTLADFQVAVPEHSTHGRLAGGKLIDSHQRLRHNYRLYELASQCCEAVDVALPFRAPSPDVFDILLSSFHNLPDVTIPDYEWVRFGVRMLRCLGHGDLAERLKAITPGEEQGKISYFWADDHEGLAFPEPVSKTVLERFTALVNLEMQRILSRPLKSHDSKESINHVL